MPSEPTTPTPPMGSETRLAKKIGKVMAQHMHRMAPKVAAIPEHRWSEKVARLGQRLVLVAVAIVTIKLGWPWYIQAAACVLAARALSPEIVDGTVKWALSVLRQGKSIKDGQ